MTAVPPSANGDPRDGTANITTCSGGSVLPPPFLPPPPIQGDRCRRWSGSGADISAASSNGPSGAGGGGGSGSGRGLLSGAPTTPNAVRDREDNRRVRVSGSGNIRTGSAGSWNGSGYLSGPETPTTAATNAAAGACLTPGICSPPTSCNYAGGGGGGRRGRGGRRSGRAGVSTGQTKRIHRLRGRCGGDRGCERGSVVAAAAPVNEAAAASGTNASLASAAAVGSRGSVKAAGDVGGGGSGGSGDGTAPSGSALGDRLGALHGGGGGGGGRDEDGGRGEGSAAGASDGRDRGRRRDKSVDSSSSVEHFSDYSNDDDGIHADVHEVDGADDAAGGFCGDCRKEAETDGSRRGRGVRLRRRRRRRSEDYVSQLASSRAGVGGRASCGELCERRGLSFVGASLCGLLRKHR